MVQRWYIGGTKVMPSLIFYIKNVDFCGSFVYRGMPEVFFLYGFENHNILLLLLVFLFFSKGIMSEFTIFCDFICTFNGYNVYLQRNHKILKAYEAMSSVCSW